MTAETDLNELLEWSKQTIAIMAPARRRILIRKLLMILRQRNLARMRKNISPDGEPWEARKKRRSKSQSKKMMLGLAKAKKMRLKANADGGSMGFGDNLIARIHHYGLLDKVSPTGPTIKYPERPLIGISEEDEHLVMQQLVEMFNV
jgi:phage virion morphogenesis protein